MEHLLSAPEAEEFIKCALDSGVRFFCCRMPDGGDSFYYGFSDRLLPDDGRGRGFVMHPFDNRQDASVMLPFADRQFSPDDIRAIKINRGPATTPFYPMPDRSTTQTEHRNEVEGISARLRQREINGLTHGKTVAARVILTDFAVDIAATFTELSLRYPAAFVYLFSSPETGMWMGASPELLARMDGEVFSTMALAGTRPVGSEGDWDTKNREEQAIVTDYIVSCLGRFSTDVRHSAPYTRTAGPIEHICTDITARLVTSANSEDDAEPIASRILEALSPTPALCGYPVADALADIRRFEPFSRGYYGGYFGLRFSSADALMYVNLRCMRLSASVGALYAGGGIMADSDPASEWLETERKASTLLSALQRQS